MTDQNASCILIFCIRPHEQLFKSIHEQLSAKGVRVIFVCTTYNYIDFDHTKSNFQLLMPLDLISAEQMGEHHGRVYDWQASLAASPAESDKNIAAMFELQQDFPSAYLGWVLRFTNSVQVRRIVIDIVFTAMEKFEPSHFTVFEGGLDQDWHLELVRKVFESRPQAGVTELDLEVLLDWEVARQYVDQLANDDQERLIRLEEAQAKLETAALRRRPKVADPLAELEKAMSMINVDQAVAPQTRRRRREREDAKTESPIGARPTTKQIKVESNETSERSTPKELSDTIDADEASLDRFFNANEPSTERTPRKSRVRQDILQDETELDKLFDESERSEDLARQTRESSANRKLESEFSEIENARPIADRQVSADEKRLEEFYSESAQPENKSTQIRKSSANRKLESEFSEIEKARPIVDRQVTADEKRIEELSVDQAIRPQSKNVRTALKEIDSQFNMAEEASSRERHRADWSDTNELASADGFSAQLRSLRYKVARLVEVVSQDTIPEDGKEQFERDLKAVEAFVVSEGTGAQDYHATINRLNGDGEWLASARSVLPMRWHIRRTRYLVAAYDATKAEDILRRARVTFALDETVMSPERREIARARQVGRAEIQLAAKQQHALAHLQRFTAMSNGWLDSWQEQENERYRQDHPISRHLGPLAQTQAYKFIAKTLRPVSLPVVAFYRRTKAQREEVAAQSSDDRSVNS